MDKSQLLFLNQLASEVVILDEDLKITWLNDSAPKQLFKDKDLQLLMFDKRMKFVSPDGRDNNKITFSSSYYCWNFLPKQIIMKELNVKGSRKNS